MKIRSHLFILIFSLLALHLHAQDMIYKTDETVITAKVLEINTSTVKYKLFSSSIDKVFELPKNNIHYIVYQNGTKEFYNTTPATTYVETETAKQPVQKVNKDFHKNIIALNCFDMLFTNFSASYERVFNSGKISLKIPVSIGLQGKPNTSNYTSDFYETQFLQNRNYAAGLELNIYPFGQQRHVFYIGISTFAGSFNYYENITTTSTNYGYTATNIIGQTEHEGTHYSGMIHLGGYIGLTDNLLLGAKLGVGFKRENTVVEDYTLPIVEFDFNLGYRF